jgi:hypothetical protein
MKVDEDGTFSAAQIQVLDLLHNHLQKAGATIAEFPPRIDTRQDNPIGLSYRTQDSRVDEAQLYAAPTTPSLIELVQAIASSLSPAPAADPLASYRALQEAADNRWWLSSSRVEELIGVAPAEKGESFDRCGFNFQRVGLDGREITWLVTKKSICV